MGEGALGSYMNEILNKDDMFSATNSALIVVDKNLNVLYHNNKALVKVYDYQRPGDFLKCTNAVHSAGGCGSSEFCSCCDLRNSVKDAFSSHTSVKKEVVLSLEDNKKLVLDETTTPFSFEGKEYAAVFVVDVSGHKQERMLEHVFFHDMMNLVGALGNFVECLEQGMDKEILSEVKKLTEQIKEELATQKELIYAETGVLAVNKADLSVDDFVSYAIYSLEPMVQAKGKQLIVHKAIGKGVCVYTDVNLLHRIVLNMVKNAVEASDDHSAVTLSVEVKGEESLLVSVNNTGVIPERIAASIFHFGESSKGPGRGIGTYSMKLFGENYLSGKVWFTTNEAEGTTFYFQIPLSAPHAPKG